VIAAGSPKDLAEAGTILPRRGRAKNHASGGLIPIAVLSCDEGTQRLGGGPPDAAALAGLLALPLELMGEQRMVHLLAVEVAGMAGTVSLPAEAYTRDEAVEVAWRRLAIIAGRLAPAQEG
jgi:hypothetical protein